MDEVKIEDVSICGKCGALIPPDGLSDHINWHDELALIEARWGDRL